MSDENLTDLLDRAYSGEVLGEALFTALAEGADDPEERRKLEACRLLEAQTGAAIASLAADLGVSLGDAGDHAESGRRGAEVLAAMPWSECMAAVAEGTGVYRSLYADLQVVLGEGNDLRLTAIVAHEHALTAFAGAEARGDAGALELLLAALEPANRERVDSVR
jgi:hypothetical protein